MSFPRRGRQQAAQPRAAPQTHAAGTPSLARGPLLGASATLYPSLGKGPYVGIPVVRSQPFQNTVALTARSRDFDEANADVRMGISSQLLKERLRWQ